MGLWTAPSDMDYYAEQDRYDPPDAYFDRLVWLACEERARLARERQNDVDAEPETDPVCPF